MYSVVQLEEDLPRSKRVIKTIASQSQTLTIPTYCHRVGHIGGGTGGGHWGPVPPQTRNTFLVPPQKLAPHFVPSLRNAAGNKTWSARRSIIWRPRGDSYEETASDFKLFTPPAKRTDHSECDSQTSSSVQPLEAGSDSDGSSDNDESEPEVEAEVATGGDDIMPSSQGSVFVE